MPLIDIYELTGNICSLNDPRREVGFKYLGARHSLLPPTSGVAHPKHRLLRCNSLRLTSTHPYHTLLGTHEEIWYLGGWQFYDDVAHISYVPQVLNGTSTSVRPSAFSSVYSRLSIFPGRHRTHSTHECRLIIATICPQVSPYPTVPTNAMWGQAIPCQIQYPNSKEVQQIELNASCFRWRS